MLSALAILGFTVYTLTGVLLFRRLLHGEPDAWAHGGLTGLAGVAVLLHAAMLVVVMHHADGLNFALTNAGSLVAWVIAALFLAASLTRPIINLGIVILPIAGLSMLIAWHWPGRDVLLSFDSALQTVHIVVSILAYSLLAIAAVQSLLLLVQEHRLHDKHPGLFLRALPPLETMESLMLRMVAVGFLLLTFTVISGVFFSEEVFGKALKLNHHIVLSGTAWLVFAVLLFGRWRFGWRGRTAVSWVLTGVTLLALGYFGSKFVLEIILHRSTSS